MNKTQLGGGEGREGRQRMLAEHPACARDSHDVTSSTLGLHAIASALGP